MGGKRTTAIRVVFQIQGPPFQVVPVQKEQRVIEGCLEVRAIKLNLLIIKGRVRSTKSTQEMGKTPRMEMFGSERPLLRYCVMTWNGETSGSVYVQA